MTKQKNRFLVWFLMLALVCQFSGPGLAVNAQTTSAFGISMTLPSFQIPSIRSAKELSRFLKENFKFTEDAELFGAEDYWQSPEEFLNRKAGDCEDYALFAQLILNHLGLEAEVISFYGNDGFAHTVTLFKENGAFNVINEDRLYTYRAASIEEALTRIHPGWTWGAVAALKEKRGWPVRQIRNPAFSKP